MSQYTRLLSFDFGLKRIGVAIGQMVTKTARPLTTLAANNGEITSSALKPLLNEWRPDALIVGLPLNMDDTEQSITEKAKLFASFLEKETGLPVHLYDERLSTIAARDKVFELGGYKALNSSQIDAVAAAIILEGWMNSIED